MNYQFNFDVIFRNFDKMLDGLWLGLWLAAVSLAIGAVIGLLVAYARQSRWRTLRWTMWLYVEFIRNCPILLLIFFIYFGLPELGIFFLGKTESFILTLAIYAGAYLSEVFRAGLSSMPVRYVDGGYGWMPNSYASAVRPGDPIWLNWVNTVYKEAMMGVDFDYFAASYKKWFGIELPTPKVGFPQEFA